MSILDVVFLRLGDLGRGLRRSTVNPGTIEIALSTQAGNLVQYGPEGGLLVPSVSATGSNTGLPPVTAANAGANLVVTSAGQWDVNPFAGPVINWPTLT